MVGAAMIVLLKIRRLCWTALALVLCTSPGHADTCLFEHCWGAVALDRNGVPARASAQRTAPEAWAQAERACGGKCATLEVFGDGCGAIVTDRSNAPALGFGTTADKAQSEALATCTATGGKVCRLRVWVCSN